MNVRVGLGYDIHRLVEGRRLYLGAIEIPHDRGLLGHSDGDAAAHAVCDAALGAAGLGDLGAQFSETDPAWKDASGAILLAETRRRVAARGFRLAQVDVSIVAEAPRLAAYRPAMIEAIARALDLEVGAVSVKARTNEGLDSIGRGEAIAAWAVVLLEAT